MNKEDKILIIGASSSIGRHLIEVKEFDHCKIIAHYHSRKIKETDKIFPVKADLRNEKEILHLIEKIKNQDLMPNKIVHIASEQLIIKHFKKQSWEDFQSFLDVQVKAFMIIAKAILPLMSKFKNAKVVTILSSVVLSKPPMGMAGYVTAKYALLGLTRALASEYPKICINSISPSMMETDFVDKVPEKIVEIESNLNPYKRNARLDDIIPSLLFLLDDRNEFMSGVNLPVTGGSVFS